MVTAITTNDRERFFPRCRAVLVSSDFQDRSSFDVRVSDRVTMPGAGRSRSRAVPRA
jgi:hypothetical protein